MSRSTERSLRLDEPAQWEVVRAKVGGRTGEDEGGDEHNGW